MLCVPKYLDGAMTLGEVVQVAAAFVTVQSALNWFVDNYQRLADWISSVNRVSSLLLALDRVNRDFGDHYRGEPHYFLQQGTAVPHPGLPKTSPALVS
jgi:ABC-type uncharacterized transport system fused permease/ATPase subunit